MIDLTGGVAGACGVYGVLVDTVSEQVICGVIRSGEKFASRVYLTFHEKMSTFLFELIGFQQGMCSGPFDCHRVFSQKAEQRRTKNGFPFIQKFKNKLSHNRQPNIAESASAIKRALSTRTEKFSRRCYPDAKQLPFSFTDNIRSN